MLTLNFLAFRNIHEYLSSVIPFLEKDETRNGIFLGALDSLKNDPPVSVPVMAQAVSGNEVIGAAFYRNRNLLLAGDFDGAAEELARHLVVEGVDVPAVVGLNPETDAFARAWSLTRKCEAWLACNQGLYRLSQVRWPPLVNGVMRPARIEDSNLIYSWLVNFHKEAVPWEPFDPNELKVTSERRIRQGTTFVWEDDDRLVAMASLTRPSQKGITVNAVYTPLELRCRGYGSALVAAVSQEGLNRGKDFCILYTDMANPVSNSIYRKIGYTLVSQSNNYRFKY
jgi:GNAT superfamily N-acetyltransferase